MYITAQQVKSFRDAKIGINVVYFVHRGMKIPGMSWDSPDVAQIADEVPGIVHAESVEVPLGGNAVLSYLDVVAADDEKHKAIEDILDGAFEDELRKAGSETQHLGRRFGRVAVRFHVTRAGAGKSHVEQYRDLRNRLLELLRQPHPPTWRAEGGLVVDVTKTPDGFRFELSPESAQQVRARHQNLWNPLPITIASSTADDFEQQYGSIYRNLVSLLTNRSLEEVAMEGGIVFKLGDQIMWKWPES